MDRPQIAFTPGNEPEIVHTQHSIPAPRMAAVSLDTLLMMRSSLAEWGNYSSIKTVINQIDRLIKAANT